MTSCPMGHSSGLGALVTIPPCGTDAYTAIPILDVASVCTVFVREAASGLNLTQRAPGIWSLSASNTIPEMTQTSDRLRVVLPVATSTLALNVIAVTVGGRLTALPNDKCITQTSHGLTEGDWIILDSNTLLWTTAFDGGATAEDDAVGRVVSITDADNFCFKPIGPFCEVSGLIPGLTYYVATDGSGALTTVQPNDISVPRVYAISASQGIVLPYRPSTPTSPGSSTSIITVVNDDVIPAVICSPVYQDTTSGAVKIAQADSITTSRVIGLVESASIGVAASGDIRIDEIMTATTGEWDTVTGGVGGLTSGSVYYLDPTTKGRLTTSAPTTTSQAVTSIGLALSTTQLRLDITQPIKL